MPQRVRIAVDAMGGDTAPGINIEGSLAALDADQNLVVELIGPKELLVAEINRAKRKSTARLELVPSTEVVSMEDSATGAVRKKRGSSLHIGMQRVREGHVGAFLSAGNSGAIMAIALVELGRMEAVERPAILVRLPTATGSITLVDAGANVDCRPSHLVQFARMGSVHAHLLQGLAHPRVALLSNGSEAHKGNELTRQCHEILSQSHDLNYVGYLEGNALFAAKADVVVCDGFVGNIALKIAEGFADTAFHWLNQQARKDPFGFLGSWLMRKTLRAFRAKFDYQPYGSAPLIGIQGMVWISHGASTSTAICNGILSAKKGVESGFLEKAGQTLLGKQHNE